MKDSQKRFWIILIIAILIAGGVVGAYYYQKPTVDDTSDQVANNDSQEEECSPCELKRQEAAQGIVDQFQSFQTDREANNVIGMMTEPETVNEENDLATLDATDGFGDVDRLYSANELTFKLVSYEITSSEKIDDNEYWFYVTEMRKVWDQTTADWAKETYESKRKFEIENTNDGWMVDKYSQIEDQGKYSGFSNVN